MGKFDEGMQKKRPVLLVPGVKPLLEKVYGYSVLITLIVLVSCSELKRIK